MFANRFTALLDACSLAGALRRNLLLTLAEADFFRARWSEEILQETQKAITRILADKGDAEAQAKAAKSVAAMQTAFEDALVGDYDAMMESVEGIPDPGDRHVIAAAIKTDAAIIVTENLKHFPSKLLVSFGIEAKSADAFIADTIDLDAGRAIAAIRGMRERFKKPALTPEALLLKMETDGLLETCDLLREHIRSL